MKQILLLLCLGLLMTSGCTPGRKKTISIGVPGRQCEAAFNKSVQLDLGYLIYLPKDYGSIKRWPLMVFLHGVGERGSDLNKLKLHGPAKLIEQGKEYPFIVVSIQCPGDKWWPYITEHVAALIDNVIESYDVDADRVYLTGLSMGGYGTWAVAGTYPDRFAAIAPICGGGEKFVAFSMKNVPVWAFHGDADPVVPVQRSVEMIETVKQIGGDAKLTIYPGVGHDAWTQTYNNDELYEWLLSHSRKQD